MSQEGNNNNDMTKDVNDIKKLNLKKENNIQNINRNNMNEDKKSLSRSSAHSHRP